MAQKAETMVRAQLLLTPAQRERLERLARREERTLSDLTRRALDIGLDALERHGEEELRRQQQILAELRCVREQVGARYGVYPRSYGGSRTSSHRCQRRGRSGRATAMVGRCRGQDRGLAAYADPHLCAHALGV